MNIEQTGYAASEAVSKALGMPVEYHEMQEDKGRMVIIPRNGGKRIEFDTFTFTHLRPTHLEKIKQKLMSIRGNGALITDYVNPKIRNSLIDGNINFVDIWGNFYLNGNNFSFSHSGNKPKPTESGSIGYSWGGGSNNSASTSNRAFDMAGMKIILALLSNQVSVNDPYRMIASSAGVSLGAVGSALDGLEMSGFLIFREDALIRRLVNKKKLLSRFVDNYIDRIKPKLLLGVYESERLNEWRDMPIFDCKGRWGGEPGAALLTNYLNPAVYTIHVEPEMLSKLIGRARLRKIDNNKHLNSQYVEVYEVFGKQYLDPFSNYPLEVSNPIIVYADLLGTQDARNHEVADLVYEQQINRFIGED